MVEARVDHDHITLLDFGTGVFKILGCDKSPFAFGDGNRHTGSAQAPERIIIDTRCVFSDMQRCVHMRTPVHDAFPLHLVFAVLGMELLDGHVNTWG